MVPCPQARQSIACSSLSGSTGRIAPDGSVAPAPLRVADGQMPNLFLELQGSDGSLESTPAPLGELEALAFMRDAEITAASLIPWGSNYSFAVAMAGEHVTHLAIYKP